MITRRMMVGGALLVASVASADSQLEQRVRALEDKVHKLEADNAKYAEALAFLQKVYEQQKAQQQQQDRDEPASDAMWAIPIAADVANGQIAGSAGAAVTMVWVFDLADPYSARMVPVIDELLATYRGKLRVVFKNFLIHPQVVLTAHAAGCAAGKQHRFVEFWHQIWKDGFDAYATARDTTLFDGEHLAAIGKTAGLDAKRLKADMASAACSSLVKADEDELIAFHVNATPTFFINGVKVDGAVPKDNLVRVIDDQLHAVAASGVPAAKYYDQVVLVKGEKKFRSKLDPKP
jgi:protein-disulfide isomerase